MRNILTVIGARPQFVKAATLSRQFTLCGIKEQIIHTGQHFDSNMSDVFFEEMAIPKPAYHLDINGVTHGAMTGRMLEGIEHILLKDKPEGVLVYGDTNSTLAGALAAVKLNIPVIHVEAGLRSFNMAMPEEINRILTDRISNLLLCPTDTAVQNLKREGFDAYPVQIVKNGDVMQDAALYYAQKAQEKSRIISQLGLTDFVLATIHRQENTDDSVKLQEIISGLNKINKEVQVVVPLHPRTRNILQQMNLQPAFTIIDPVGYFDMIMLLKHCKLVVTDSGGVQKEAFFFGKHCITLREQTEWVELVQHGYNRIVGTNPNLLLDAFQFFSNRQSVFSVDLYGNGRAAEVAAKEIGKM
ncbi:MAG: UDP-N-acetylglucosamine 2-epimerase (non-hydrolyzing) [Paludibacter sp.]|nr:UDP-N-acetylglucosamine 2-epimerase (non-hydrolyzing) [Paludibacter sp.]MDD4198264.1 UDP-N-acetylglucosamine 2-epimerase (non-hydrolyzing) [Paludibacter sp.]MDD4428034.1 UDP-N-acetylglucosamine 2-epimerase (non-hydrolyzing) [Paludibacter sp.]